MLFLFVLLSLLLCYALFVAELDSQTEFNCKLILSWTLFVVKRDWLSLIYSLVLLFFLNENEYSITNISIKIFIPSYFAPSSQAFFCPPLLFTQKNWAELVTCYGECKNAMEESLSRYFSENFCALFLCFLLCFFLLFKRSSCSNNPSS